MQATILIQSILDAVIAEVTQKAAAAAFEQCQQLVEQLRIDNTKLEERVRELEKLHVIGVQGDNNDEILGHNAGALVDEVTFAERMSHWLGQQGVADSELSQWADAFVQERGLQDDDDVELTISNAFDGHEFADAVRDAVDNLNFEVRVSR